MSELSKEELKKVYQGLISVEALINESSGVSGLHLNGDEASWIELRTGGHLEEWLLEFDEALELVQSKLQPKEQHE